MNKQRNHLIDIQVKISKMDKNELIMFNNDSDFSQLNEQDRQTIKNAINIQYASLCEMISKQSAEVVMSELLGGDLK